VSERVEVSGRGGEEEEEEVVVVVASGDLHSGTEASVTALLFLHGGWSLLVDHL
jgi:hypothetical protein